ncbi:hypothetical protein U9M48_013729 [Paspalum notatum var. saurae]|uniref:Uncharacterized protein n=1 Tax=Paspalum notatum var. saurae TaxID=547442 RepID=A0AAQ3WK01_PASNO
MSSMGTPLVSGSKSATTKSVVLTKQAAKNKKKKSTNLRWHSMAKPSSGGITSLGTSHPSRPQDHANPST